MSNRVNLSPRDVSLLRLLSWTPATTALIHRASSAFEGDAFADERRLRERLQALIAAGFVRAWPAAQGRGGLHNYYKLTPTGFAVLHGPDIERPSQAYFAEVAPLSMSAALRNSLNITGYTGVFSRWIAVFVLPESGYGQIRKNSRNGRRQQYSHRRHRPLSLPQCRRQGMGREACRTNRIRDH
ncbi:MAG TPA: hypothetical protein VHR66_20240 [Gemmataceae bacterium]|nr:hypothetical protein [Gemmataceae bacterium]